MRGCASCELLQVDDWRFLSLFALELCVFGLEDLEFWLSFLAVGRG